MVIFCKPIIQINANFHIHIFAMRKIGILMDNQRNAEKCDGRVFGLLLAVHTLKTSQFIMMNQKDFIDTKYFFLITTCSFM